MQESYRFLHFFIYIYMQKPKNYDIIKLKFLQRNKIIDENQYERILQYLESKEEDVYNLGITTLNSIIQKSSM